MDNINTNVHVVTLNIGAYIVYVIALEAGFDISANPVARG